MQEAAPHILVCEDSTALACVVRFNLERAGYRVTVAKNGRLAWEFVQQQPFDLVITDEQMPEMTGSQFCARMRRLEAFADIPVILLTAKSFELDLARLRDQLGITATFSKPFSPSQLVIAVENFLTADSVR